VVPTIEPAADASTARTALLYYRHAFNTENPPARLHSVAVRRMLSVGREVDNGNSGVIVKGATACDKNLDVRGALKPCQ
jgi:hypothetical protein